MGGYVEVSQILTELDKEIARLQEARTLLAGGAAKTRTAGKKGIASKAGKRKLSPEGRRRIAEAMKRRWAERKKQASSKSK
jgi:hypothetical protein